MFKVTFRERIGLPSGGYAWFQKTIEIPFVPFIGLTIDGLPFKDPLWSSDEQSFVVSYDFVVGEFDDLQQAIHDQAKDGWELCPEELWKAERKPLCAIQAATPEQLGRIRDGRNRKR